MTATINLAIYWADTFYALFWSILGFAIGATYGQHRRKNR